MKKDILIICLIVLLCIFVIGGTEIQSVEEYYLTHLDDIKEDSNTVFLSIRCDTVYDNYDMLDDSLKGEGILPKDGIILPMTEYVLRDGDSVYDILSRAVRHNRIQMEYQGADKNGYGSVNILGMNYLYAFSCGPLSGWIYMVNGVPASEGCSLYMPKDGDVIEWVYTCDLGDDIYSGGYHDTTDGGER